MIEGLKPIPKENTILCDIIVLVWVYTSATFVVRISKLFALSEPI